jgi:hypothetical protein
MSGFHLIKTLTRILALEDYYNFYLAFGVPLALGEADFHKLKARKQQITQGF